MNRMVTFGVRQLFGGARRGQAGLAGLGAALAIIGWLRDRAEPKQLLYRRNLKPGEEVRIKFLRGEAGDEISVSG
jgi:hypothetical protein